VVYAPLDGGLREPLDNGEEDGERDGLATANGTAPLSHGYLRKQARYPLTGRMDSSTMVSADMGTVGTPQRAADAPRSDYSAGAFCCRGKEITSVAESQTVGRGSATS
jgi:hypothetical protein